MITGSPGHYGKGTGAHGLIDEGAENIRVTKEVVRILRASGITTNYIEDTVNKTAAKNINWLVAQHNKTSRVLDFSIHFNSVAGTYSRGIGTEVLVKSQSLVSLANKLSFEIAASSGIFNRGAKVRDNLGLLNGTNKPCVLIEVCFVNDTIDVALYRKNFGAICQAIAKTLAEHVGKSVEPPKNNYEIIEDKDAKVWRIQSGAYTSKDDAISAFKTSGMRYATIRGTVK